MTRVVLVTGVSRQLAAARVARTLAAEPDVRVVAVDVVPPAFDLGAAQFVRADIRNPVVAKVITSHDVDTVVHQSIVGSPAKGGRTAMKELNVIGTMQLLAACQRSQRFRRLVVQSSVSVYGSSPRDPARFTEEMSARVAPRSGLGKDSVEIEGYVRGLARRRPEVGVAMLRLADLMGAGVDTTVSRHLTRPVVPTVAGFDARLQFLHPADAVAAIVATALGDIEGTFNVAAPDVLALSQVCRILGRPTVAVPGAMAPSLAGLARRLGAGDLSVDQIRALTYGRAMDISRFVSAVGFEPRFSSRAAVEELAAVSPPGLWSADRLGGRVDAVLAGAHRG